MMSQQERVSMVDSVSVLPQLPLAGRTAELAALRTLLERAAQGHGGTAFITGAEGVGKSRLTQAVREEAERRGFLVATGCGYPLEAGVPYSVFCDLLDPLVRAESPEAIASLTRGAPEFRLLCPSISADGASARSDLVDELPDLKSRLLWNLPAFLDRLRKGKPLLLVLEDLEWADPSSIELIHFLGRRSSDHAFLIVCSFGTEERGARPALQELSRALESRSGATLLEIGPLDDEGVLEAVTGTFGVSPEVARGFAGLLRHWTGGNPLFLRSVLESLVQSGRLHREAGRWAGWTLEELPFPGSAREIVTRRIQGLRGLARRVAELAAAAGTRVRLGLLGEALASEGGGLLTALDELRDQGILREDEDADGVAYAFVHPLVREVLYADLGLARSRALHAELARALETIYGDQAVHHAREMAMHILQGGGRSMPRTTLYLAAAGRAALAAHANREAELYLEEALRAHSNAGVGTSGTERHELLVDLGRARQRRGRFGEAEELLAEARRTASEASRHDLVAGVDRRLALAEFWSGRFEAAFAHWERGLGGAKESGDAVLEARIRLGKSACLQEMGRPEEAAREAQEALRLGEQVGDREVGAAAHRTLMMVYTWTGPPETARKHGERAVALARELSDDAALFSATRAMAVLEGLTGHAEEVRRHLDEGRRIADRLASPLARLQLAEIEIEYWSTTGAWDRGVDVAEESIRMARELNQQMILSRLLVPSGLLHLNRGNVELARAQLTEAWDRAHAPGGTGPAETHFAILAHIGRAALHLASREFDDAMRVGEGGLRLVDRSGYRAWAVHRLLPLVGEAALHLGDVARARRIATRLRKDANEFGHAVGLLWADACEALANWRDGNPALGARQMAAVADQLESVASIPDAARLRRQLAGRLADLGQREAAIRELRRVHDILSGLGAEPELDKARTQFREVGARPPIRSAALGTGSLTVRETEIAHMVGERKSNKAIGRALGISPRTVGTHLSNIFRKLAVDSRHQLGDLVREGLLDAGGLG